MTKKQVLFLAEEKLITLVASNANQSIANNTFVKVNYNIAIYEENTSFDLVNDRYIIPSEGYYSILASNHFASNASGSRGVEIRVNGIFTDSIFHPIAVPAGHDGCIKVYREDYFNGGDIIEVYAWQNSGGALNLNVLAGMYSYLSIKSISREV